MMLHEAGLAGAKGMDFVEIYPRYSELPDRRTRCMLGNSLLPEWTCREKENEGAQK